MMETAAPGVTLGRGLRMLIVLDYDLIINCSFSLSER